MVERRVRERADLPRAATASAAGEVREYTGWGDTQLKIHLARLAELEYLLVHRGGRGQAFEYELLYDGASDGERHLSGLIDIEALRERSAAHLLRRRAVGANGRVVGPRSASGRA